MVRLKNSGVTLNWESRTHVEIMAACHAISAGTGLDIVATSGNDGKHSPRSLHYQDRAIDIRTWDKTTPQRKDMMAELRYNLNFVNTDYDIVYEPTIKDATGKITRGEHLHVEYDPK